MSDRKGIGKASCPPCGAQAASLWRIKVKAPTNAEGMFIAVELQVN